MSLLSEIFVVLALINSAIGTFIYQSSNEVYCKEQNNLIIELVLLHFEQDSLIDCTTFKDSTIFDNSVLSLYTEPEYQEFFFLLKGLRELNERTVSNLEYSSLNQSNCADYRSAREVGFSQVYYSDDCSLCIIYYQENYRGEAWGGYGSIVILERKINEGEGWKIKLTSNLWRS